MIVIIIPEVVREPKFDLEEGEGLSMEQQSELSDYQDRLSNYASIFSDLNKWPVNDDWNQVIDDKGPIVIKNDERYHCYTLPDNRIDRVNVKSWLARQDTDFAEAELDIHTGYLEEWTVREWLSNNLYEKLLTEGN
jgi:hypothetical protein